MFVCQHAIFDMELRSMAFIAPIFMNLTVTQQIYVSVFIADFVKNWKKNV